MSVSDADRERVIAALREQAGEGRLDMDEYGQRLDEAYSATTMDELQRSLRELPVAPLNPAPAPAPLVGQARPRPPRPSERRSSSPARHRPPRPPMPLSGPKAEAVAAAAWKGHLGAYIWVNLMLVAIWAMTDFGGYFWPMWPMAGWGFGLGAHGMAHRAGVKARARRRELNS